MKNPPMIPISRLYFDLGIYPGALKRLRGAVIEQVLAGKKVFEEAGMATDLFHNHNEEYSDNQGEGTFKRYPLIQYKVKHKKAELLGIGTGAKALQLWYPLSEGKLKMAGKQYELNLLQYDTETWKPVFLDEHRLYRLNKWLPFSIRNYAAWQNTPKLADKAVLLDKILWGHIFHFFDGLGIQIPRERLEIYVSTIDFQTYKRCYGVNKLALDITFICNLELPEALGLGQGVSIGFGKLQCIKNKAFQKKQKKYS